MKSTLNLLNDAKEHNESSKRTLELKRTIWTHAAVAVAVAVAVAALPSPTFPFKMSYQCIAAAHSSFYCSEIIFEYKFFAYKRIVEVLICTYYFVTTQQIT